MIPVRVLAGDGPVILGQPHGGTHVPAAIAARLNARGLALTDTDWHIDRLYDGLLPGASVVRATFHRYVVDANRDPAGVSLYPGQNTTDLCPTTDFDGLPIWQDGQAPDAGEIAARRAEYHAPYHAALAEQVARARDRHGVAIVFDCHSIRSVLPFLFSGRLADFSIGTSDGTTCAPAMARAVADICAAAPGYSTVVDGRFKGGWTTRHYGRPQHGIHAIQMELAQRCYLTAEAAPWDFAPEVAMPLRATLGHVLSSLDRLARSGALAP